MEKHMVICNMCGREFDRYDLEQGIGLAGRLKYGSIYDGRKYALDLCCSCFDNIIDECVVSPLEDDGGIEQCVITPLEDDGITETDGPTGWKLEMPRNIEDVQVTFDPDGTITYGNK